MKKKLLRLRYCNDCEEVYWTYAKYSDYCIKCFLKRTRKIQIKKWKRIYIIDDIVKITDDRIINNKELTIT